MTTIINVVHGKQRDVLNQGVLLCSDSTVVHCVRASTEYSRSPYSALAVCAHSCVASLISDSDMHARNDSSNQEYADFLQQCLYHLGMSVERSLREEALERHACWGLVRECIVAK